MKAINILTHNVIIIQSIPMSEIHFVGKAEFSTINSFEDTGKVNGYNCRTCHCPFGHLSICTCGNCMCEACERWSTGKRRVLNLNQNKRTKKTQRYVLEYIPIGTRNCNMCNKIVGYRL